jgi:hypothetical protein
MENYLTVRELAVKVQLSEQTIYRFVLFTEGRSSTSKQGEINFTSEFKGL